MDFKKEAKEKLEREAKAGSYGKYGFFLYDGVFG